MAKARLKTLSSKYKDSPDSPEVDDVHTLSADINIQLASNVDHEQNNTPADGNALVSLSDINIASPRTGTGTGGRVTVSPKPTTSKGYRSPRTPRRPQWLAKLEQNLEPKGLGDEFHPVTVRQH